MIISIIITIQNWTQRKNVTIITTQKAQCANNNWTNVSSIISYFKFYISRLTGVIKMTQFPEWKCVYSTSSMRPYSHAHTINVGIVFLFCVPEYVASKIYTVHLLFNPTSPFHSEEI